MRILRNVLTGSSSDFEDLLPFDFFDRAARMRELHKQGRYAGTSKIGTWNSSEEKRQRMVSIRAKNALDKTSTGYGSERKMRLDNKNLILSQYTGQPGYLYFLDFPGLDSIKVGFSKNWEFRTTYQLVSKKSGTEEKVLMIISGTAEKLAELEYDTLLEYQKYTRLNPTGTRYTEYLDRKILPVVYKFLENRVRKDPGLKFEIKNNL